MTAPLWPGATLGVLGGGQLGRMLGAEARRMGYRCVVLDPDPDCPAAATADRVIEGALTDPEAARRLADACDVATLETEHIPWEILAEVEARVPLRPAARVLRAVQDRLAQKRFLAEHGLPQAAFAPVEDLASLEVALAQVGTPAVLKSRTGGYDGKGQARLHYGDDPRAAWRALGGGPAIAEAFVPFALEISVVLARGADGEIRYYEIAENVHEAGILRTTLAPARVPMRVATEAEALGAAVARALGHVGVLAVEMFLCEDGTLRVNEIAPRVHNSGHYTLGACATSQFEQHVRAVCGVPLADQRQLQPAVMLNLLGDLWRNGPPDLRPVLAEPFATLHLYGKRVATPGRKMGHVLVRHAEPAEALAVAHRILDQLERRAGIVNTRAR